MMAKGSPFAHLRTLSVRRYLVDLRSVAWAWSSRRFNLVRRFSRLHYRLQIRDLRRYGRQ